MKLIFHLNGDETAKYRNNNAAFFCCILEQQNDLGKVSIGDAFKDVC